LSRRSLLLTCEASSPLFVPILVTAPFYCDLKSRAACAQSFAPWQQATTEITRRDHFIIACSRHVHIFLFFAHIPFVVNQTINATSPEKLQHMQCFENSGGANAQNAPTGCAPEYSTETRINASRLINKFKNSV